MTAALAYDLQTALPDTTMITVASDLFGPLTVDAATLFTLPKGMLGFPECLNFVLLAAEREHVYWMQSVESSRLAFLLIDPFALVPNYQIDLTAPDMRAVLPSPDRGRVFAVVTLPSQTGGTLTANLQGPVILDTITRMGAQIVIPDGPYTVREAIQL